MNPVSLPTVANLSMLSDQKGFSEYGRARHVLGDEVLGKQFESVFASMLVKNLRESLTEEGLFPGDSADALGSLFDQYIGQLMGEAGGMGVAKAIQPATPPGLENYRNIGRMMSGLFGSGVAQVVPTDVGHDG